MAADGIAKFCNTCGHSFFGTTHVCVPPNLPKHHPDSEASMAERLREMTDAAHRAPALERQEGGGHYKDMAIQPFTYIHANGLPFAEGCVVKYVSRWRSKGGVEDLKKARHFLDLLIEAEQTAQNRSTS